MIKNVVCYLTPLLALILAQFLLAMDYSYPIVVTLCTTLVTAIWWLTEAIPVPAASLLPLCLFGLFGILSPKEIANAYGSPLILLMLGGFMLSKAVEKSQLHLRIANNLLKKIGTGSERRIILTFMITTALLSMWISNTTTTLMILPIALATLKEASASKRFETALLLSVAYAANIGGMGTPIGTPPNIICMQIYNNTTGEEIAFLEWMSWTLPIVLSFLFLAFIYLTYGLSPRTQTPPLPDLGKWRSDEKRVMLLFATVAFAWVTRKDPFGGWSHWLQLKGANDASVALLGVIASFVIPSGKDGEKLLDWDFAKNIPWGTLLLFGGGISIALAFQKSGLSVEIGNFLSRSVHLPTFLLLLAVAVGVGLLTQVTSNTATTTLLMPILAITAVNYQVDPKLLMVPAALSASCAFMLPVATAPNAIVFGSKKLSIKDMVRNGGVLNLIGVFVIAGFCYALFA